MKKISTLIFDLDGVLIDSFEDVADALNYACRCIGTTEKHYEKIQKIFGNGVKHLVKQGIGEENKHLFNHALNIFNTQYQKTCLNKTKLYSQARNILEYYKNKNLAIVTNKPENFARFILKALNVENYFEYIIGPESVEHKKPHPEAIIKLLERFYTNKECTLMIGDSATDIAAGKAAGVLTCAATYGFGDRERLLSTRPDYQISSLQQLKDLFV